MKAYIFKPTIIIGLLIVMLCSQSADATIELQRRTAVHTEPLRTDDWPASVRHNFPRVHNLLRDPKVLHGIGGGETGAQNLTWVLPAITKEVIAFQKTLGEEPPIKLGTPEPYVPSR